MKEVEILADCLTIIKYSQLQRAGLSLFLKRQFSVSCELCVLMSNIMISSQLIAKVTINIKNKLRLHSP